MSGAGVQPVAVALAVTAAATFAVANVVQQRVAAKLRSDTAFDTAVLLRLVRRPLWLAGLGAVVVSLSLQATALDLGRLVVIEPVLASSLLFALALAAWADHHRMRPVEWLAALATFAGLVVFLSVARPSGGQATASPGLLGLAALAAVVAAVTAGLLARRLSPLRRALTLGVGGGIAAGVTDALTKTVAALIGAHQLSALADVRPYLLVVIGLLTYTMQQNGYRAAGLAAFLPLFSVLDPAVGSLLGLALYHEHLGGGAGRIAAEVAAVLAATWGISRLARSTAEAEPIEPVQPVRRRRLAEPIADQLVAPVLAATVLAATVLADTVLPDTALAATVLAETVLADPFPGAPDEPSATR
jgi:drug/metabolite transporter (DMT)-like permease